MLRIPPNFVNLQIRPRILLVAVAGSLLAISGAAAQENPAGPQAPPPEHKIERVIGVAQPEAPPSLPPAQIINSFTKKEDLYFGGAAALLLSPHRAHPGIRPRWKTRRRIRCHVPGGALPAAASCTRKLSPAPQSSLQYLQFEPDDAHYLGSVPAFPLTTDQLSKYNVKFLGSEKVDEIDCYIFEVHPKTLDRKHPLFDGILWVDQKYLEVVKTYGKWVTDLGPMRPGGLPFNMFETYRENVEGKYWFPNYSRSEDVYKLKDREVPVRVTIKWSDFKPFPANRSLAARQTLKT